MPLFARVIFSLQPLTSQEHLCRNLMHTPSIKRTKMLCIFFVFVCFRFFILLRANICLCVGVAMCVMYVRTYTHAYIHINAPTHRQTNKQKQKQFLDMHIHVYIHLYTCIQTNSHRGVGSAWVQTATYCCLEHYVCMYVTDIQHTYENKQTKSFI